MQKRITCPGPILESLVYLETIFNNTQQNSINLLNSVFSWPCVCDCNKIHDTEDFIKKRAYLAHSIKWGPFEFITTWQMSRKGLTAKKITCQDLRPRAMRAKIPLPVKQLVPIGTRTLRDTSSDLLKEPSIPVLPGSRPSGRLLNGIKVHWVCTCTLEHHTPKVNFQKELTLFV